MGGKALTGRRGGAGGGAMDKLRADAGFQRLEPLRDGRLCEAEGLCCALETAGLQNGRERDEMIRRQGH